jgi:hypothetical protein
MVTICNLLVACQALLLSANPSGVDRRIRARASSGVGKLQNGVRSRGGRPHGIKDMDGRNKSGHDEEVFQRQPAT